MLKPDIATQIILTLIAGLSLPSPLGAAELRQVPIPRVDQMPNLPQPYRMRDWRRVTADYLELVLDFDRQGKCLPVVSWRDSSRTMVNLPSYVGGRGGPEGINFLAAVVSGGLVDLDMRKFHGQDWVAMCTKYFVPDHGVCGNNPGVGNGGSFWYDLFPNVLFYQVCALNPGDSIRETMLRSIADRWYTGCLALGARTNASALPDFDHTSFNLHTMSPIDNGRRVEPDGAAGVAWCEYLAWTQFKDPRYLTAADWAVRALEQRPVEKNPLYEVLLPYGALIAARMNAELGRHYDVARLLNWCFEPMERPAARPGWGVIADRFGSQDCHGLVGSVTDTEGYAFAMNTFEWAGALAPLARYDPRYARALGKWLLNLANASRLFYANGLPAEQQDHRGWADMYDTNYCIAYEGLRRHPLKSQDASLQPYATGDACRPGSEALNFCLYGSSHVGILGGLISRTSEATILQIDLLRTDFFHAPAYPTFLFYNPNSATTTFEADFGSKVCDLYDAVSDQVVHRQAQGRTRLSLAGDTAAVIVAAPAGATLAREGGRLLMNGIVVKWQ